MQRVGHYEFGMDRRAINVGDTHATRQIMTLWHEGSEIEGWAQYWANLHHFLADRLSINDKLRAATLVVRYEDFVADPRNQLERLFSHVNMDNAGAIIDEVAPTIHAPSYYKPKFSDAEITTIRELTGIAAARFGYENLADDQQPA
jgi:hypothetical protein